MKMFIIPYLILLWEKKHYKVYSENRHPAREGESGLSSTQLLRWRLVHQAGALFVHFLVNGALPTLWFGKEHRKN